MALLFEYQSCHHIETSQLIFSTNQFFILKFALKIDKADQLSKEPIIWGLQN